MKNYYLSLETCKQLKEWGCDFDSNIYTHNFMGNTLTYGWNTDDNFSEEDFRGAISLGVEVEYYKNCDLRDIICNGEIAKAFFGEGYTTLTCGVKLILPPPLEIACLLQQNKKESAEQYLLENTIFNPKNR